MIKLNTQFVEHKVVTALHDGQDAVLGGTVLTREQLGRGAWRFVDYWHIPPGDSHSLTNTSGADLVALVTAVIEEPEA